MVAGPWYAAEMRAEGFCGVFLLACTLGGCGAAVCQPDRCAEGLVCSFEGRCEAPPEAPEEPEVVDTDAEPVLERMALAPLRYWGVGSGQPRDEVRIGGDEGDTLYLAFELPADSQSAVLELRFAEDRTFGGPTRVNVRPVSAFTQVEPGRLPGVRPGGVSRRSVPQEVLRFEVDDLRQGSMVYLAVEGEGPSPGFRIATPGATMRAHRPRLSVRRPPVEPDSE